MFYFLFLLPLSIAVIQIIWPANWKGLTLFTSIFTWLLLGISVVLAINPQFIPSSFVWWETPHFTWTFAWRNDKVSQIMGVLVCGIYGLVQQYSFSYLAKENKKKLYYVFLALFVFSMLGIVYTSNLITLFFCWELVGVCSWFLIGFWNEKKSSGIAARKALLLNRIGDAGLLSGILLWISSTGQTDLQVINLVTIQGVIPQLALALMLIGVMGKSAQFPFHSWLPDAMAGPTPASALMHAATMVAAGVYFCLSILPMASYPISFGLAGIGAVTAVFSAWTSGSQSDIKRTLAYSTLSHLGLMIMIAALGATDLAFFHLGTHAIFKCGLFLIAGVLIHQYHVDHPELPGTQEIHKLNHSLSRLPFLKIPLLILLFALAGLPLFSGGLSKESILAFVLYGFSNQPSLTSGIFILCTLTTFAFTGSNVFRLIRLLFSGPESTNPVKIFSFPVSYSFPILITSLGALSIFINPLTPWKTEGAWILHNLYPLQLSLIPEPLPWIALILATGATAIGGMIKYFQFKRNKESVLGVQDSISIFWSFNFFWERLITLTLRKFVALVFLFDLALHKYLIVGVAQIFRNPKQGHSEKSLAMTTVWVEKNILLGSVNSLSLGIIFIGDILRSLQTGKIQSYLWKSIVIGTLLLLLLSWALI